MRADTGRQNLWEVVRYDDPATAFDSLKMTGSAQTLIGGVDHGAFALISGLDKSGPLIYNPRPFGHYFLGAADAFCKYNRILVVGYGGRDPHLNTWLDEHADIHGDERRAVAIMPYEWQWGQQHRRGENLLLRVLFGRLRWDRGHGTACGKWNMNRCVAGPTALYSMRAQAAFIQASRIIDFLDEI